MFTFLKLNNNRFSGIKFNELKIYLLPSLLLLSLLTNDCVLSNFECESFLFFYFLCKFIYFCFFYSYTGIKIALNYVTSIWMWNNKRNEKLTEPRKFRLHKNNSGIMHVSRPISIIVTCLWRLYDKGGAQNSKKILIDIICRRQLIAQWTNLFETC